MQDLRIEGVDALRIEGVDALWAGWCHEGGAAELVRALKYGRVTAAVTPIADRMASVMPAALAADLVTWVPCSPTRRRERGFDPAELLARALARRLRLRARLTLRRLDDEPQTAPTREGRLAGPGWRSGAAAPAAWYWSSTTCAPPARRCVSRQTRSGAAARRRLWLRWPQWRPRRRGSQSRYLYHEGASKLSKDVGRGYLDQQPAHRDNAGP